MRSGQTIMKSRESLKGSDRPGKLANAGKTVAAGFSLRYAYPEGYGYHQAIQADEERQDDREHAGAQEADPRTGPRQSQRPDRQGSPQPDHLLPVCRVARVPVREDGHV